MKAKFAKTLGALLIAASLMPSTAHACAACFGASDSPMAQGMNMGIFTLLIVVMGVLIGIAGFFFYILRRSARMASEGAAKVGTETVTKAVAANPEAGPLGDVGGIGGIGLAQNPR